MRTRFKNRKREINTRRALPAMMVALLPAFGAPYANAQGLGLVAGNDSAPIEIDAEDGIEWQREIQLFIARGNAVATRGQVTTRGDELHAYYNEKENGSTEIWRLDAKGHVSIATPSETAYGAHAVYDVEKSVLVLKPGVDAEQGKGRERARLVSGDDNVSATEQIEYWEKRNLAVARGDAVAVRGDRRIAAKVLVAHLQKQSDGKTRIHRIEAFDAVHLKTQQDEIFANKGAYNVSTGMARLVGDVRLIRGANTLHGCSADVDTNRGVSTLHACKNGEAKGRVRGTFVPNAVNGQNNQPDDQPIDTTVPGK